MLEVQSCMSHILAHYVMNIAKLVLWRHDLYVLTLGVAAHIIIQSWKFEKNNFFKMSKHFSNSNSDTSWDQPHQCTP